MLTCIHAYIFIHVYALMLMHSCICIHVNAFAAVMMPRGHRGATENNPQRCYYWYRGAANYNLCVIAQRWWKHWRGDVLQRTFLPAYRSDDILHHQKIALTRNMQATTLSVTTCMRPHRWIKSGMAFKHSILSLVQTTNPSSWQTNLKTTALSIDLTDTTHASNYIDAITLMRSRVRRCLNSQCRQWFTGECWSQKKGRGLAVR